jgi:outer membrane usher protein
MKYRVLSLAGAAASLMSVAGAAIGADTPARLPERVGPPDAATSTREAARQSLDEPAVTRLFAANVTVNGDPVGNWVLMEHNGRLFATSDAFEEWRLNRVPGAVPKHYRGQPWYPLNAAPGFRHQLNATDQSLALNFAASAFAATRLTQDKVTRAALTPAIPAFFANYDLSYTHSAARGTSSLADLGALTELGASGQWGLLTSSFVGRGLNGSDDLRAVRRLETTYTRDFLGPDVTLRIGDSSTRPAAWGRSVYFGGVQLGRNFGLRPGFISQPLPVLIGTSTAPSTVELYINDSLRQTSRVPAGPFAIDNFPMLTGSGQAQLVVRDILGRETVLTQDFFSHANLLEQGLADWSVELGKIRSNIGLQSADYGQRFASALWRFGLNKTITVEAKGEGGNDTRGAGFGLAAGMPFAVLGELGVAASRNETSGSGHLWQASLSRTGLVHSFTFNLQSASAAYRQIGQDDSFWAYKRQHSASYNFNAGPWGALGVGYAKIDTADSFRINTNSFNYTVPLGAAHLTVSLVRVKDSHRTGSDTSASFNLFIPLGGRVATSTNVSFRENKVDAFTSAALGLDGETGWGWRALGGYRNDESHAEGGVFIQSARTFASADLSASSSQQTLRLGLQGAVVALDGEIFASRRVPQSFAVVEVPGYANVGVNMFGSTVAKTDDRGRALVPRLASYQENSIRLDPSELPISAELDTIEQVAVPGFRSAVKVVFPVRSGRGALLKFALDDGLPAPAGAELELVGDKKEFFVARRGEAFVTGLQAKNTVRLRWNGQSCAVDVELPPGGLDEIARVGPLTCRGVSR